MLRQQRLERLARAAAEVGALLSTDDDPNDPLSERRRLLQSALEALQEVRDLTEASAPKRSKNSPRWFRGDVLRLVLSFAGASSLARVAAASRAAAAAAAGAWADLLRREAPSVHAVVGSSSAPVMRRFYLKIVRSGPATPPRPPRIHGCVEFLVDGVVKASSTAPFGDDAGSRGCSVHAFDPPVAFRTKSGRVGGNVAFGGDMRAVNQDFEVRAVAVADKYACSWTGHTDERLEWLRIDPVADRHQPYFHSILAALETRVPLDEDCCVCTMDRSLCDAPNGVGRRSDLTTVFVMRKDRSKTDQHVFELHAVLLARTWWDYDDETGGLFSYGLQAGDPAAWPEAFWRESWRPNARGDPALPWKRIDGW